MNIAFLIGEFPKLSETFILQQIVGCLDAGHDVTIFARRPETMGKVHEDVRAHNLMERTHYLPKAPEDRVQRVREALGALVACDSMRARLDLLRTLNVWRYGNYVLSLLPLFAAVPFAGSRASFDAVLAHFGPNGVEGTILRDLGLLQGGIATVFHGADMSSHLDRRGDHDYRFLAEHGDLFLPISTHWKEKLEAIGFPPQRTHVHHMGVDCSTFSFKARRRAEGEPVRLVSVARLTEKKGLAYAIRAIAAYVATDEAEDVQYTIVGGGPLEDGHRQLAARLGVEDVVEFAGWMEAGEVADVLQKAHLFMAPSVTASNGDKEGIPVAIMEAMACGLPVISTYHSGIPELVEDRVTGRLVEERNVTGLADAIGDLAASPDAWVDYGRAGRRKVEDEFDITHLNEQLLERLQALSSNAVSDPIPVR